MHSVTSSLSIVALLIAVLGSGCASKQPPPPPLAPPSVTAAMKYQATAPAASVPAEAPGIVVDWIALAQIPRDLPPLLADARVIESPHAADPFLAVGRLTRGAKLVPEDKIDALLASPESQRAALASSRGVLLTGANSSFTLNPPEGGTGPLIEVALQRATDDLLRCSITLDRRERIELDPQPMTLPARFAVILPAEYGGPTRGVMSVIRILPPGDDPEHQKAVAESNAALSKLAAAPPSTRPAGSDTGWEGLAAALVLLDSPGSTRASLVYLASETGAQLSGDVALAADDETLAELAKRVASRVGSPPKEAPPQQIGWQLESACMEQLAAMQTAEKLPSALAAVLSIFAGEAGRRPGSLDELTRAGSIDALRARLVLENFNCLEDSAPGARVRAYDWLTSHGQPLTGYDPLGDVKQRRAALDQAITAAAKTQGGAR